MSYDCTCLCTRLTFCCLILLAICDVQSWHLMTVYKRSHHKFIVHLYLVDYSSYEKESIQIWRSSSGDKGNSRKHGVLCNWPGLVALTPWQRSLFFVGTVLSEKVEDTTWTVATIFTVLQKEADLWSAAKMSVAAGVFQPPVSRTPQSLVATDGKRVTSFSLPSTTSKMVLCLILLAICDVQSWHLMTVYKRSHHKFIVHLYLVDYSSYEKESIQNFVVYQYV
jgi:hypothetical protein